MSRLLERAGLALEVEPPKRGIHKARLTFPQGDVLHFCADEVGIGVCEGIFNGMPELHPSHMLKTIQKFGSELLMVRPE